MVLLLPVYARSMSHADSLHVGRVLGLGMRTGSRQDDHRVGKLGNQRLKMGVWTLAVAQSQAQIKPHCGLAETQQPGTCRNMREEHVIVTRQPALRIEQREE